MNIYLENFIYFIIGFVLIFLCYLCLFKFSKKDKTKENIGINFLVRRHDLDLRKHDAQRIYILIAVINSFIISFVSIIVVNIDNLIYKLLVGFVLLMVLIYSLYEITGRILKKKEIKEKKVKVKKEKRKKEKKNV